MGVVIGFLGVAVVIRRDQTSIVEADILGRLLVLVAVVVVAFGSVLIRRTRGSLPIPALTGWSMVLGGGLHTLISVGVGESIEMGSIGLLEIGAIVYLGLVVGTVGFGLFLYLIEQVAPLRANLTGYVTPVVAVLLGIVCRMKR